MALTWKQVAAPDLSAGRQGYETFTNLLNTALSGGQRALGKFDADISERVNNELALKIMQYSDPEKLKADAAAGILVNPGDQRRVSAETLRLLSDHPTQLLNQKEASVRIDGLQYDLTDKKKDDAARNAASGLISDYQRLAAAGDTKGAEALLADPANRALVSALDVRDQAWLLKNGLDFGSTSLANRSGEFNFSRTREEYADKTAADAVFVKVRPKITSYAEWERRKFGDDPDIKALSPAALKAIDAEFAALFPVGGTSGAPGAPGAPSVPGSTGSGNPGREYMGGSPYNAVFGHGAFGLPDKPVEQMTIGEAVDYGRKVMIPATKGKINKWGKNSKGETIPLGTSAIGGYQFTQETLQRLAPIVFKGQPWQTLNMSPENQDKMARYLFEERKNGNLQATWEGLPDARPGAYKDKTFDQMKPLIFLKEAGSADLNAMNRAAQAGNDQQQSTGSQSPIYAQFSKVAKSDDDIGAVTAQLIEKGTFKGARADYVADTIQTIAERYNMKPAIAGLILSNSFSRATRPNWLFGENSGNGLKVNWQRVGELAKDWERFKFSEGSVGQATTKKRGEDLEAARVAYNQAEAVYNAKLERKKTQPDISIDVEAANLEKARAALSSINLATRADKTVASFKEDAPPVYQGPIKPKSSLTRFDIK